jgi:hypothetical protein
MFERAVSAGLSQDEWDVTWVRHVEHDQTELHFIIPSVNLASGKAWSPLVPIRPARVYRLHGVVDEPLRPG